MITGKLKRDVRLFGGKECADGVLRLRGEEASVHPDYADLIDKKRTKRPRRTRAAATDKQAVPPATK
jgi:hypothetical protein